MSVRMVQITRNVRKPIDNCTAADLRLAAQVSERLRLKALKQVENNGRMARSNGARKMVQALEHAMDVQYFTLLAQRLDARAHGRRAILGRRAKRADNIVYVSELGKDAVHEIAEQAAHRVKVQTG